MKYVRLILFSGVLFVMAQSQAADAVYGLFMVVKGDVKVTNLQNQVVPCKVGTKVFPGETIASGVDSRAKIVMSDRNVINLSPSTTVKIEKYEMNEKTGTRNVELNLIDGKVRNNVEQKYDGEKSKFLMKTPTAVAGVRGTQFVTSYDKVTQLTQVVTLKGVVTLAPVTAQGVQMGKAVLVKKGEMSTLAPGGNAPEPPKKVPQEDLKKVDKDSTAQNFDKPKDTPKEAANSEAKEGKDSKGEKGKGDQRAPASEVKVAEPKMVDKKDMEVGSMTQDIRVPTSEPAPAPPQVLPPAQAFPPPPNPLIGDIVRTKLNKTTVKITPAPF